MVCSRFAGFLVCFFLFFFAGLVEFLIMPMSPVGLFQYHSDCFSTILPGRNAAWSNRFKTAHFPSAVCTNEARGWNFPLWDEWSVVTELILEFVVWERKHWDITSRLCGDAASSCWPELLPKQTCFEDCPFELKGFILKTVVHLVVNSKRTKPTQVTRYPAAKPDARKARYIGGSGWLCDSVPFTRSSRAGCNVIPTTAAWSVHGKASFTGYLTSVITVQLQTAFGSVVCRNVNFIGYLARFSAVHLRSVELRGYHYVWVQCNSRSGPDPLCAAFTTTPPSVLPPNFPSAWSKLLLNIQQENIIV